MLEREGKQSSLFTTAVIQTDNDADTLPLQNKQTQPLRTHVLCSEHLTDTQTNEILNPGENKNNSSVIL